MSDRVYVRPAEGRLVLLPGTRDRLEAEGREVDRSSYWIRRIADSDVLVGRKATNKPPRATGA